MTPGALFDDQPSFLRYEDAREWRKRSKMRRLFALVAQDRQQAFHSFRIRFGFANDRTPLFKAMRRRMILRQPALDIFQWNVEQSRHRLDLVRDRVVVRSVFRGATGSFTSENYRTSHGSQQDPISARN
jgi:hypothetical protein